MFTCQHCDFPRLSRNQIFHNNSGVIVSVPEKLLIAIITLMSWNHMTLRVLIRGRHFNMHQSYSSALQSLIRTFWLLLLGTMARPYGFWSLFVSIKSKRHFFYVTGHNLTHGSCQQPEQWAKCGHYDVTIHEFHENCHSVTSYFMKKDYKWCCDTTTPESIHTKDESKRGSAFAFIFGVNWPLQLM